MSSTRRNMSAPDTNEIEAAIRKVFDSMGLSSSDVLLATKTARFN